MDDAGKGEPDKKQKRIASQSFLVPCGNGSVKQQCVAHCGGLEALKVEVRYKINRIWAISYEGDVGAATYSLMHCRN